MPTANSQKTLSSEWEHAIELYLLAEVSAGRPRTTVKLRRDQLSHMARCIGCAPTQVTDLVLVGWFGRQEWKLETRRSYRTTVRGFFAYLQRIGMIASNPGADLPAVKMSTPSARPTPESAYLIARVNARARVELMVRLAGEIALRRSEVAQVHVRDLCGGPSLLVHGKGSKERLVPITEDLDGLIRRSASPSGWLFPGETDGHLSPKRVGVLVSEVLPDGWTMHTLRHRAATRAYRGTRNLRAVQALLGHESIMTTQRYLAVDDAEIRAAMLAASNVA